MVVLRPKAGNDGPIPKLTKPSFQRGYYSSRKLMRPSNRAIGVLSVAAVVAVSLAVLGIWWNRESRMIPEIARGATAGGGLWGACPDPRFQHPSDTKEALSPEFNARLVSRFPPGSSEQMLVNTLQTEGFGPPKDCDFDHAIKWSEFRLNGNEVVAQAYWTATSTGTIVWTKGFVAYTFL